jgi:hypothetical protein
MPLDGRDKPLEYEDLPQASCTRIGRTSAFFVHSFQFLNEPSVADGYRFLACWKIAGDVQPSQKVS